MSLYDLRQWVNSHPVVFIIPLVLLIALAVYAGVRRTGGPTPTSYDVKLYFYDEDSGETVIHTDKDIPPLNNDKGMPVVVRAAYMSAGEGGDKTLVYLVKYTDEAKASLEAEIRRTGYLDARVVMGHEGGSLVRRPEKGSPWVPAGSAEGRAIMNSFQLEHATPVRFCNP